MPIKNPFSAKFCLKWISICTKSLNFALLFHDRRGRSVKRFRIPFQGKVMEITSKIRIKDIAERAGVSVGTVDRIIHGRGNVSPISMERVQKVLDEINFTPNHYA